MLFNSRSVAFLLAVIVGLITVAALSMLDSASSMDILVTFMASFLGTFIVCFLILELLFFKELRSIYQVLERARGNKPKMEKSMNKPLSVMHKELVAFSEDKNAEILKLKRLEEFRREFLADISHELKTPIFSAQGFIHTLLDGAIDDESVRMKFLKKSATSLDHLDNLVQDLVAISQLETGEIKMELELFNLENLVSEVFEQLEHKAKKRGISLKLIKDVDRPYVIADIHRIMQVFKNLIDNSLKYGNENGSSIVELNSSENNIYVSVRDNGPGIPDEHQPHIFKRFYRVDKSRSREKGGTGLGLSIVKHILEAHGSKIKLTSDPINGTVFTFKLKRGYEED